MKIFNFYPTQIVIKIQFIILLFFTISNMSAQYFISPSGNDSNIGDYNNPFYSVEGALKTIRTFDKNKNENQITVSILAGYYKICSTVRLTEEDTDIVFRPYKKEKVIFSGGIIINPSEIKSVIGTDYQNIFSKKNVNNIYFVDLKKYEIKNYGMIKPKGFARPYSSSPIELFINEKAGFIARWPNDSTVSIDSLIDTGSNPRIGDHSNRGAVFHYSNSRPDSWVNEKNIWISGYFNYGYAEDAVKIASIDTSQNTITTVQPHLYGFSSGKVWNRWYAYNILKELDSPAEYYIDSENEIVFFYSTEKIMSIELSLLEKPMFSLIGSKNIKFDNINFQSTRGMAIYLEKTKNCKIMNSEFKNIGMVAVSIGKGIKAFNSLQHEGTGEPRSELLGSIKEHRYQNSTFKREGGHNNAIINCSIYNTGAGGVHISGGDRITLESGNNYIENTTLNNFNRLDKSYCAGVDISGVGNRISNCEIFNAPSMAILLHGNNHIVENNDIYDVCKEVDDMGAFYYGRNPSELGTIIRNNFFHDIPDERSTCSVYIDDGACGLQVLDNIFIRSGKYAILLGGGSNNIIKGNYFENHLFAIHIDKRLENWASAMLDSNGIFSVRLNIVNYLKPPYINFYPFLENYFSYASIPTNNILEKNVFYGNNALIDRPELINLNENNIVIEKDDKTSPYKESWDLKINKFSEDRKSQKQYEYYWN